MYTPFYSQYLFSPTIIRGNPQPASGPTAATFFKHKYMKLICKRLGRAEVTQLRGRFRHAIDVYIKRRRVICLSSATILDRNKKG